MFCSIFEPVLARDYARAISWRCVFSNTELLLNIKAKTGLEIMTEILRLLRNFETDKLLEGETCHVLTYRAA